MTTIRKVLPSILLLLVALGTLPQESKAQTATPYDCSFVYTFTDATTQTGQTNFATAHPCIAWRVTYTTVGFTTATVQFETSPDNSSWTAVPNAVCSATVQPNCVTDGASPITAGVQGTAAYRAYGKYVRINVTNTSAPGVGNTGTVIVYGYKGTSASAGTGSGGGSSGGAGGQFSIPSAAYNTGTYYLAPGGGLPADATETNVQGRVGVAGTVSNFTAQLPAAPGSGNSVTFTWRKGAADQVVTCAISGASATSCADTTHSFAVALADLIDIKMVVAGATVTTPMVLTWGLPGVAGPAGPPGGGTLVITTGAGAPAANCAAPSSSNLAEYQNTTTGEIWFCVSTNVWQKFLSTPDTGPVVISGASGSAPSLPSAGNVTCYFDSTTNTQICLSPNGNALTGVKADTGAANNFLTGISAAGIISKAQPTPANVGLGNVTNDVQTKASIVPNSAPSGGQILIGDGSQYQVRSMSGDCLLSSLGVTVCATLNSIPFTTAATPTTIAERNASGELIAVNTVATGKTPMATDTAVATAQLATNHIPYAIAKGTVSLGTTTVNTGTCSSAIDGGTATGVLTTDVVTASANADPTGVTGYTPATTGTLYVWAYPTSDHVNFKLCNNTATNITPGSAVTLNWYAMRVQ